MVYSADPVSREKGRYWLRQMLILDSQANLLDMYVGTSVDNIFQKVKKEYLAENPDPQKKAGSDNSAQLSPKKKKKSNKWIWATSAGIGLVAVGATTYFLVSDSESESELELITVPKGEAQR